MSIEHGPTPDQMGVKPEGKFDKYHEGSKQRTPEQFGAGTVTRLEELCRFHPTEADIKAGNVEGMEYERQKLQIDLFNLLETIPSKGDTELETQVLELIRSKISSATGDTIVSGKGEHLTLDPQKMGNIYNIIASAHIKMNEALVVLKLLESKKE